MAEYTLDTLARLMALEQARVVTEDKGRLIDRAWQATLRTLRSLAGAEQGEAA
ncbi:putative ATPase [Stenotrophomonas sp. SORGH_AS321]|nr:putative ATPase [Stenotrophomonas sp. SORGH_AS_0321]